jgi:hypothetical protein
VWESLSLPSRIAHRGFQSTRTRECAVSRKIDAIDNDICVFGFGLKPQEIQHCRLLMDGAVQMAVTSCCLGTFENCVMSRLLYTCELYIVSRSGLEQTWQDFLLIDTFIRVLWRIVLSSSNIFCLVAFENWYDKASRWLRALVSRSGQQTYFNIQAWSSNEECEVFSVLREYWWAVFFIAPIKQIKIAPAVATKIEGKLP